MFSGSESRWDFEYTQIAVSIVGALYFGTHVSSVFWTQSPQHLGFDRIELCKAKAEAEDMGTRPSCTFGSFCLAQGQSPHAHV